MIDLAKLEAAEKSAKSAPWSWKRSYEMGDGYHWAISDPVSESSGRVCILFAIDHHGWMSAMWLILAALSLASAALKMRKGAKP